MIAVDMAVPVLMEGDVAGDRRTVDLIAAKDVVGNTTMAADGVMMMNAGNMAAEDGKT